MTQTEYYKRYSEDENDEITEKEYDKAEKYLEALQKIMKDWFND